MHPAVSIIMPAYNTERYLSKCIESITCQTFRNWELIIADDGSTDGTYAIAQKYAESDSRITVIHNVNRGVSVARNYCLEIASGDYLCFIDSDDTVAPGFLEALVKCAEENSADIAQCSFSYAYDDGRVVPYAESSAGIHSGNEEIMRAFFNGTVGDIRVGTWAKLFRRDKFGKVRFDANLRVYEDAYYTYQCCRLAEKAVSVDNKLYNYLQREGSAMNSRLPEIYEDYFTVFEKQAGDNKDNSFISKRITRRRTETALWLMSIVIAAGKEGEYWKLRKKALSDFADVVFSSAPFGLKLKLTGLAIMPHIYLGLLKRRKYKD